MLRFNPDVRSPNGWACGNSTLGAYVSQHDRRPTDGAIKCPVFNRPGSGAMDGLSKRWVFIPLFVLG